MTLPELQEFAVKHLPHMPADERPAFLRIICRIAYDAGYAANRQTYTKGYQQGYKDAVMDTASQPSESTLTCHLNDTTCRGCGACEN